MPVFDDKTSFEVHVMNATVSIKPDELARIMNSYVFARADSPLKDISILIDKDSLIITGKLHNKGDIAFGTVGTVSATPDGRLRVHTEKVSALHVPMKGLMWVFGVELANVANMNKIDGIDTDKNDLVIDVSKLMPPPHVRGNVTSVRVEDNEIVVLFGDGGRSNTGAGEQASYMRFEGNRIRLGKLLMQNVDLVVLDLDSADSLDWSMDHYKDQLVPGYTRMTTTLGLRVYVKDFGKLTRPYTEQATRPQETIVSHTQEGIH